MGMKMDSEGLIFSSLLIFVSLAQVVYFCYILVDEVNLKSVYLGFIHDA